MQKKEDPCADVAVLVGRFQVHELHEAHLDLINTIQSSHPKTIVFLGLSPVMVTQNNPLDFESRKQMILEKFPNVNVLYIKDCKSDNDWSAELDEKIGDIIGPNKTVVLYGSRDCFIKHYTGKYKTQELVQETYISGTEVRKAISKKVKNTSEFRAGVIWAAYNKYPTVFTTVDIAIMDETGKKVLLARKPKEEEWRFVGGFADPNSNSFEDDAKREVAEETGCEVSDPEYIGSYKIVDWRYEREIDKIKTVFFACKYIFGPPKANDDIIACKWFMIKDLTVKDIVEEHHVLLEAFLKYLKK